MSSLRFINISNRTKTEIEFSTSAEVKSIPPMVCLFGVERSFTLNTPDGIIEVTLVLDPTGFWDKYPIIRELVLALLLCGIAVPGIFYLMLMVLRYVK